MNAEPNFQPVGAIIQKKIVDPWVWYFAALADPSSIGKTLLASEDDPKQGYYRCRRGKGQPWLPVAIFYPEGSDQLVGYINNREARDLNELWVWCLRYPISDEAYERAIDGGGWADDDPVVASQIAPAPPGHNLGDVDEADVLRDQIEAAKAGASAYAKIHDDETASKGQSLRNRLNELSREANQNREAQKKPHFEAGKAVDAKWQPLVKSAKEAADGIKSSLDRYETDKLRARREAEKKAEDERRAAEATQQPEDAQLAPAPAPVATPPVQTQIRGNYGKAASITAKIVVTAITNHTELFGFLNGHPELDDLMLKLAQRAVDAGRTVPGVTLEEKATVR